MREELCFLSDPNLVANFFCHSQPWKLILVSLIQGNKHFIKSIHNEFSLGDRLLRVWSLDYSI